MIGKLLRRQEGQALLLALAFMVLAVPLITSALALAGTLSTDSANKTHALKAQYAAFGAQQYSLHSLIRQLFATTTLVYINGVPATTTVAKLIEPPPGAVPIVPRSRKRPFTTKIAYPTSTPLSATTTYSITLENQHDKALNITKIYDELAMGFAYVAGSTQILDSEGTVISASDPSITVEATTSTPPVEIETLTWPLPSGTTLDAGDTMTAEFVATVASTDGLYCNEAYVDPGGKKTRSGKTARVTVGSTSETLCHGAVVSINKTVDPEFAFGNTTTTYTYTIEVVNEGTQVLTIKDVKDYIREELTYVSFSLSSTPESLHPGKPKIKTKSRDGVSYHELVWKAPEDGPYHIATSTTWTLQYEATATLPRGFYASEVELKFDNEQLPTRSTGQIAIITVVDVYRITVVAGGFTYECDVWFADDVYVGDFHVVDGCYMVP